LSPDRQDPSEDPSASTPVPGSPDPTEQASVPADPQLPLRRGADAAQPRTLVDIVRATAAAHPEAAALDDGSGVLSYEELLEAVEAKARELRGAGVRRGDRVGVRVVSGSRDLYVSILGILFAGAAYVLVDADDTDERARLVFGEADVAGIVGNDGYVARGGRQGAAGQDDVPADPRTTDDAWIIFTSGSTGKPKGVAVTHRNAAAFVDAEANMFLQDQPLGPDDRVLAGLSVAFDASCEEMWLAWRHGACLVPAPRALVRSGSDLAQWLTRQGITVISTVPTLAGMWPKEAIENVRLLIFGGEACPQELAARLAEEDREVWNTYGPTEGTVVACGCRLTGEEPVSIGLPLQGWDLAVVDASGRAVGPGESGELIIGGVGLARYLDPVKDAEKYAPMPSLGWSRAYRSGDMVRYEPTGLMFQGRVDDQVKIGGKRIELGEVEAALQDVPGVAGAAAAVRSSAAGVPVLVGYLVMEEGAELDRPAARSLLTERLPAGVVPLLAPVESFPVRTSGKVDKDALPWPLAQDEDEGPSGLSATETWVREQWQDVLGVPVPGLDADFFDLGGGSLAAAQLVSRLRTRAPEFTVADIYDVPRLGAMAAALEAVSEAGSDDYHRSAPTRKRTQWAQTLAGIPLFIVSGLRWLLYALVGGTVLEAVTGLGVFPTAPWWMLVIWAVILCTPFGRMGIATVAARLLLRGVQPGDHPRGGSVHMRLWLAEQFSAQIDAVGLAGAPWIKAYARGLGAKIGRDVTLHTLPPITGMLQVGDRSCLEPEVDLAGYWIDGDVLRLGEIRIGNDVTVGARSTLAPGTRIDARSEIAPGSAVFGRVKKDQHWAGSPAVRVGATKKQGWPKQEPPRSITWTVAYAVSSVLMALLPFVAFTAGGLVLALGLKEAGSLGEAALLGLAWMVPAVLGVGLVYSLAVVVVVRLMSIGVRPGDHPVHSRVGWQVWTTERLLDAARTFLFPLYASLATPVWLRLLGAKVGRNVEASTVLLLPHLTRIDDGAFLADDTMVASYELHRGWMRIGKVRIGKRAFLGNSGMAGPGHKVPKDSLVAVLSSAPEKAKARSSWLGSPAVRLRRLVQDGDDARTYHPGAAVRMARGAWEICRLVPVVLTCALGFGVMMMLAWLWTLMGGWTILLCGIVMLAAGAVAAGVSTVAKWVFVGRIPAGEQPLWSSFVWRTEVSDTFTEMLCAPWFANSAVGTPALNVWLRSLGVGVGHGVWCDTYWLPEPDLVSLGDGATVNRGCVVQTHLFHDRIMSMAPVALEEGATLGPHSVILPAGSIGAHATVGPASLVMRGESVPEGSRFSGNPIGPWKAVKVRAYQSTR
jgi:non-ribosomal peptide synthetase-like protein